jgi:hypothetical protein
LGTWQPVCYYFFFHSIKLIQFHSDATRSKQKGSLQPLRKAIDLRSMTPAPAEPQETKIL